MRGKDVAGALSTPATSSNTGGRIYASTISNGTPAMLELAVRSASLERWFQAVWSIDTVGVFKPAPAVYRIPTEGLGWRANEMPFVSSNAWDAAGAKAAGYLVCWCNRSGEPADALGYAPDMEVDALDQIRTVLPDPIDTAQG